MDAVLDGVLELQEMCGGGRARGGGNEEGKSMHGGRRSLGKR